MGRGIAHLAAMAGFEVELTDLSATALQAAQDALTGEFNAHVAKRRMSADDASIALSRIRYSDNPTAESPDVDLAIEAIIEDVTAKSDLLSTLESAIPNALLATNTSALSIALLSNCLRRPENLIGLHFFNPVPRMKVVEVVPSLRTAPTAVVSALEFVANLGHEALLVRDTPGFMINWLGRGMLTEALAILSENACAIEDLDEIARDVLGLRMGPFELMDLTGLDISHVVMENIWAGQYADPRLRPSPLAAARVNAGLHGRKTKQGFYSYPPLAHGEVPLPSAGPAINFLRSEGSSHDPDLAPLWEDNSSAGADIHVVFPLGEPTYRTAHRAGLPADRTIGIDPLSVGTGKRLSISIPLSMPAELAASVVHEIKSRVVAVTASPDGTAPVAQRILASIINVASSIAESGCSTPADIDKGARLGLGYPMGPFEFADKHGLGTVVEILDRTHAFTHDPRYQATTWLRTRAELSMASAMPPGPFGLGHTPVGD